MCAPCNAGTYSERTGTTACQQCAPEHVTVGEVHTVCVRCPAGTLRRPGENMCVDDLVLVLGSMTVNINLTVFERHRSQYVAVLTAVANVPLSGVYVLDANMTKRRLLQRRLLVDNGASVIVEFEITTSASDALAVSNRLTTEALGAEATAAGIPAPIVNAVSVSCGMGLTRNVASSKCVPCARGRFKSIPGNGPCMACPDNTFSDGVQPALKSYCEPCASNAMSTTDSTACICNAGFARAGDGTCTQCLAGTLKLSPTGIVECVCFAGYEARNGRCNHCIVGSYGATGHNCTACEVGKYSDVTASTTCTLCRTNSFQLLPGAITCDPCSAGLYSVPGSSACRARSACPDWSNDIVDATVLVLSMTRDGMSINARQDSFEILDTFTRHYNLQSAESLPLSCTSMYEMVVTRMRSDADSDALVPVVNVALVVICVFMSVVTA